jgi:hypothetical protein
VREIQKCVQRFDIKNMKERPRHRWDGDIEINLLNLRSNFMYWVYWIQDKVNCGAFVNMVMNFCVTLSMGNFFSKCECLEKS